MSQRRNKWRTEGKRRKDDQFNERGRTDTLRKEEYLLIFNESKYKKLISFFFLPRILTSYLSCFVFHHFVLLYQWHYSSRRGS